MKVHIQRHLLLFTFVIATNVRVAWGYEITTHEQLSLKAAESSIIQQDPKFLPNFGLTNSIKFKNTNGDDRSIVQLIGDGARFEDGVTPCDSRPSNHFYNPLNGSGLYAWSGLIKGVPSPDWALEDKGDIPGFVQQFSYKDAREFFYKALTGRILPDGSVLANQAERDKYFGLTFQTLGQVIHHIQDMAQPQHVRNDIHVNFGECWLKKIFGKLENPSLYESWTDDARANLPTNFSVIGYNLNSAKFTSTFNQPRKFWTTTSGEGLAQFTNSNFVSSHANNRKPVSVRILSTQTLKEHQA